MAKESAKPATATDAADSAANLSSRLMSAKWIVVAALVVLVSAGVGAYLLAPSGATPILGRATGEGVLAALDEQRDNEAEALARQIESTVGARSRDRSAAAFALGKITCQRAAQMLGVPRVKAYRKAAQRLQKSADLGFPVGRSAQGYLLLGESLLHGGQPQRARESLERAAETAPNQQSKTDPLLALAYARSPHADPDKALRYLSRSLKRNDQARGSERLRNELLHAELLGRLERFDEARQVLAPLKSNDETRWDALLAECRLTLQQGREQRAAAGLAGDSAGLQTAHAKLQAAIEGLRQIQSSAPRGEAVTGQAMYLVGVCLVELGDERAALDQFERTYKRYVDLPEGWAALVEIVDLKLRARAYEDATQSLAEAVRVRRRQPLEDDRWISADEFRVRLIRAYSTLVENSQFALAIQLTQTITPPLTQAENWEFQAKAMEAWGRRLIDDAGRLSGEAAIAQRRMGRARMRAGAVLYGQLAKQRFATRQYPADRLKSAECYLEAQNYHQAATLLRDYLEMIGRRERPPALVLLARTLVGEGKFKEALAVLNECIEFHARHPARYGAHLLASAIHLELGDYAAAERSLLANLDGDLLTPASKEWRESLFALGSLLHLTGRYEEAIERLSEAIQRYPDDHQTWMAQYLLADSELQLAASFGQQLDSELVEESRRELGRKRQRAYELAASGYQVVVERLGEREMSAELKQVERAVQRTSIFNWGASLVALGRYAEALEPYTLALNRYPNMPEALAAYAQVAICHRRLGDPDEAQTALSLARVVLDRMPANAPFAQRTGLDAADWNTYLTWLRAL
jgi:tetratricopeptide (TPR) repeat protein